MESCLRSYFECAVATWKITSGWFRLFTKLSLTTSMFLTGVATIGVLDETTRQHLGVAAIICEGLSLFFEEMRDFATEAIEERTAMLKEITTQESDPSPQNGG